MFLLNELIFRFLPNPGKKDKKTDLYTSIMNEHSINNVLYLVNKRLYNVATLVSEFSRSTSIASPVHIQD